MKLSQGGAIANLARANKQHIEEISFKHESGSIQMWINKDSLSYLDINETIGLRNELNEAIKELAGV